MLTTGPLKGYSTTFAARPNEVMDSMNDHCNIQQHPFIDLNLQPVTLQEIHPLSVD